ncbi:hypothetical protein T492DRAFT_114300 [Pavlovales sp. CCMP2436]|nr:hypothetical protein T492DRAFT_114300 [Pavlovales sp. CCMP2436]
MSTTARRRSLSNCAGWARRWRPRSMGTPCSSSCARWRRRRSRTCAIINQVYNPALAGEGGGLGPAPAATLNRALSCGARGTSAGLGTRCARVATKSGWLRGAALFVALSSSAQGADAAAATTTTAATTAAAAVAAAADAAADAAALRLPAAAAAAALGPVAAAASMRLGATATACALPPPCPLAHRIGCRAARPGRGRRALRHGQPARGG